MHIDKAPAATTKKCYCLFLISRVSRRDAFNLRPVGDVAMRFKRQVFLPFMLASVGLASPAIASNESKQDGKDVTFIQMGDIHGHLVPRPSVRSDAGNKLEGGLARLKTKVDQIRAKTKHNLLINTGDTIQGSGEALYTRGQALVDVIDLFKVDVFAPGNWDFVYGKERFVELFVGSTHPAATTTSKRWGALASNVYHAGVTPPATILPGTMFKNVNGIKIGIIGCTTNRGPQVVGEWVTDGLTYTDCAPELKAAAAAFRAENRASTGKDDPGGPVDLVVVASEIEIGRNIQVLRQLTAEQHIDIVLNSDMHEEVSKPIEVTTAAGFKSMIVEQGMDGTALGEITFKVNVASPVGQKVAEWKYTQHRIDESLKEDSSVAKKVAAVSKPYTKAGYVKPTDCNKASAYWNMFSETCLHGPLDVAVGTADVNLSRANFDDEAVPAILEGSSHNWIADGIRWWAASDMATVRGFRYGTTVKAGAKIMRNDLYHFVPIGPRIGKASRITAVQLRNQVDNSSRSTFGQDSNIDWRGGWMFAYSGEGFSVKLDPYSVSGVDNNPNNGNPLYAPLTPADVTANKVDKFAGFRKPSRARDLTFTLPCAMLPPAEQNGCTKSAVSHITNNTNGDWTPAWSAVYADGITKPVFTLAPGNGKSEDPWKVTAVAVNRQNIYPIASAAGYWYYKTPETINNCPNCFPFGTSNDKTLSSNTPYLLPVNADESGKAMLDSDGVPIVKVYTDADSKANAVPAGFKVGDWIPGADGKPQPLGRPIDLVEILEGYLKVGNAKPTTGRVTLWNDVKLPGREMFGFPVLQPLCGTIGLTPTTVCP